MQDLIDTIRVAIASDASDQQKASGAQACRTILAALTSEPGKPLVLPGTTLPTTASRVSVEQVLDLMIARLTTIASEREAAPQLAPAPTRGLLAPATPVALPRPKSTQPTKRPNLAPRKP